LDWQVLADLVSDNHLQQGLPSPETFRYLAGLLENSKNLII
jgi:hypothetical protein